jgi:hypothetical protein
MPTTKHTNMSGFETCRILHLVLLPTLLNKQNTNHLQKSRIEVSLGRPKTLN